MASAEFLKRWNHFLEVDCQDLLLEDFYNSPPEDFYLSDDEDIYLNADEWANGPCWDLSLGLKMFLNLPPTAIVGISCHSAVRADEQFIDGLGVHSLKEFTKKWQESPGFLGKEVIPLSKEVLSDCSHPAFALKIARRLGTHFKKEEFLHSLQSSSFEL